MEDDQDIDIGKDKMEKHEIVKNDLSPASRISLIYFTQTFRENNQLTVSTGQGLSVLQELQEIFRDISNILTSL